MKIISSALAVFLTICLLPAMSFGDTVSVIRDFTYNGTGTGLMYGYINNNEISTAALSDGSKVMRFYSDASTNTPNGFADISLPELADKQQYIFDFYMKVNDMTGSSTLGLLDSKDTSGNWTVRGFEFGSSGRLSADFGSFGNVTIPFGEWVRLSFAYDLTQGNIDVYLNGTWKARNYYRNYKNATPVYFRFDLVSPTGSKMDVAFDWFRIYEGTTLLSSGYFDTDPGYSVVDNEQALYAALSGKTVFLTTNNSLYYDGVKTILPDNKKLVDINGTLMIPKSTLEDISGGSTVTQNGSVFTLGGNTATLSAVTENGILYLPFNDAVQNLLGKTVSHDVRGMEIIADDSVPVRTNPVMYLDRHKVFYGYDLIYRYLLFDNPRGEEIVQNVISNFPNKAHPRIYWTDSDISFIKSKVSANASTWRREYNMNKNEADNILGKSYNSYNQSNKQSAASAFQADITALATAYLMTDDERYAAKGVELMKGFAAWTETGYQSSNLTIGHLAQGLGIGFDSFYNYMASTSQGQEDIAYLKERITALLFDDHIEAYSKGVGPSWITLQDNFLGCIGGGMMCLLLAVCDEDDMRDDAEYLLQNVLRSLYIAAEVFYPDGGYYEGATYGDMMLENFTNALDALYNCCNTDYGIGNVPGFSKAGEFFVYMNTPTGRLNFHDDGGTYYNRYVPEYMAYRYGEYFTGQMGHESKILSNLSSSLNYGLKGLYYYDKAIAQNGGTVPDTSGAPLDKYFSNIGTGTFRSSHTDSTPTYVGFHGGYTNIPHDMLDLGEFSFISDGVIWAEDLGPDSYNLPGYFGQSGYNIYRKRPEGENCLVLNPQEDVSTYYGQTLGASSTLLMLDENKKSGAMAALDLTAAYSRDASAYTRGYYFGDNRHSLTVQDEVTLRGDTEAYWFMHTSADITIVNSNQAILTKNGKSLTVDVYCNQDGFELKQMAAAPLSTSPSVSGQNQNTGYKKLAVYVPDASGELIISVKLSPDGDYGISPLEYSPISEWEIAGDPEIETLDYEGIPGDSTLTYSEGNYTMEIYAQDNRAVTFPNNTVSLLNNGNDSIRVSSRIKYPTDNNTQSLRYEFDFELTGVPNDTRLNVYKNDMTTKIYQSAQLTWSSGQWKVSGSPTSVGNNTLVFTVDLLTGEYLATVNGGTLLSGTFSQEDLADGIGMVEFYVRTSYVWKQGIIVKDASLTEVALHRDPEFAVNNISFSGNLLAVNAGVTASGNMINRSVLFIIGAYDASEEMLTAFNAEMVVLREGYNSLSTSIQGLNGGTKVCAYIWDAESFAPLYVKTESNAGT